MQDVLLHTPEPEPSSNFAKLNGFYPYERASDWCRGYLGAALEHLEMWANYIAPMAFDENASVVHRFRPAETLSRAAIESAAQSVWITGAGTPEEALRRHICLVLHDIDEQRKAARVERKDALKDRYETVRSRGQKLLGDEVKFHFPTYLKLVKDAAALASQEDHHSGPVSEDDAESLWRAAAGSAHGKNWPALVLQEVSVGDEVAEGIHATTRVPKVSAITEILQFADLLVSVGVGKYALWSGSPEQLGKMLTDATTRLGERIPRRPSSGNPPSSQSR